MTTHSRILAWRIPWTKESGRHRVAKSDMTEVTWYVCTHSAFVI